MREIKNEQELHEVLSECDKTVLKIGTGCCGPCGVVEKNLETLKDEFPDVAFLKVDADEADEDLLDYLGIRNIPTVIFWLGDKEHSRFTGVQSKESIKEKLLSL